MSKVDLKLELLERVAGVLKRTNADQEAYISDVRETVDWLVEGETPAVQNMMVAARPRIISEDAVIAARKVLEKNLVDRGYNYVGFTNEIVHRALATGAAEDLKVARSS